MENSLKNSCLHCILLMFLFISFGSSCNINKAVTSGNCLDDYFGFLERNLIESEGKSIHKISPENFTDSLAYFSKTCLESTNIDVIKERTLQKYYKPSDSDFGYIIVYDEQGVFRYVLYEIDPKTQTVTSVSLGTSIPLQTIKTH